MDSEGVALSPAREKRWAAWAGLLVSLYLLIYFAGWGRNLIGTEVWALYQAGRPFPEQMEAVRQDLVHPPLMYLLERAWLGLFGQTDAAARSLPPLINIPAIVLFTLLASRVTRHWRVAAFLFSGNYFIVGGTVNQVRMYGLGILLAVAAILMWEAWRKTPDNTRLLAWSAVALPLVYTHFFGLLLLAGFCVLNWLRGPRRWAFTAAVGAVGLLYLPWLLFVSPVLLTRGLGTNLWWVRQFIGSPLRGLSELPFACMGFINLPKLRPILLPAAALGNLALAAAAWKTLPRLWPPWAEKVGKARWFWMAVFLTGVPVALLYGFSVLVMPAFASRFILGILPAYWLLVVILAEFGGAAGRVILYGFFLPWVLVSAGSALAQRVLIPSPLTQATAALTRQAGGSDLILCNQPIGNLLYWEWNRRLERGNPIICLRPPRATGLTDPEQGGREQDERLSVLPWKNLEEIGFEGVMRVWLVVQSDSGMTQRVGEFLEGHGFHRENRFQNGPLAVAAFARGRRAP